MKNKKSLWLLVVVCALQLFVPVKMVYEQLDAQRNGTQFKFRTAAVDPIDPLRGRYVELAYADNVVYSGKPGQWADRKDVYAQIGTGRDGFAKVISLSASLPDSPNYIKVNTFGSTRSNQVRIVFPMTRFHMQEFKAPLAEAAYAKAATNRTGRAYAVVSVKNGIALVTDVKLDGKSLRELEP